MPLHSFKIGEIMTREKQIALVEKYIKCLTSDTTDELPVTDDVSLFAPLTPDKPYRGKANLARFINSVNKVVKVINYEVERHVCEGNIVCTMWEMRFKDNISLKLLQYFEFKDGKVHIVKPYFFNPAPFKEFLKKSGWQPPV